MIDNLVRWSQCDQRSLAFHHPEEHVNPPCRVPPLYSTTFQARDVAVGVYKLSDEQVHMLTSWEPCHIKVVPEEAARWTDRLVCLLVKSLEYRCTD